VHGGGGLSIGLRRSCFGSASAVVLQTDGHQLRTGSNTSGLVPGVGRQQLSLPVLSPPSTGARRHSRRPTAAGISTSARLDPDAELSFAAAATAVVIRPSLSPQSTWGRLVRQRAAPLFSPVPLFVLFRPIDGAARTVNGQTDRKDSLEGTLDRWRPGATTGPRRLALPVADVPLSKDESLSTSGLDLNKSLFQSVLRLRLV
jgi:hypothetical protein